VSVTVTVLAPAPADRAWERWADVGRWPEWNPQCISSRVEGPLEPGTLLDLQLRHPRGRPFYSRPRISEAVPGEVLAWESRGLGLRAVTTTRFAHDAGGTRIDLVADSAGVLAFTYRMTVPQKTLVDLYTAMLDALVEDLRE
jgi:uncharacterized protein YndB with AHSA1/START domain